MLLHLPQPRHTRILHRRIRVQPLGDSMGNSGLALFGEQGEELFLPGNQGIDFPGLALEEGGKATSLPGRISCDGRVRMTSVTTRNEVGKTAIMPIGFTDMIARNINAGTASVLDETGFREGGE